MGCNSSTTIKIIEPNKKPINKKNRPPTPGPKSIAFEVKLDDDKKSNGLIKSKLPKRLQRLEENATLSPITAEEILERQRLAEKRRKSAIEERVLKSKYFLDKILSANQIQNKIDKNSKDKNIDKNIIKNNIDKKSSNKNESNKNKIKDKKNSIKNQDNSKKSTVK